MNCKETERMIPAFLSRELAYKSLKQFLEHVENCPDCMEELTIQYLVMTGAILLEEGKSFDLPKEIKALILEAKEAVYKRKIHTIFSYILEILTFVVVVIILSVVIF